LRAGILGLIKRWRVELFFLLWALWLSFQFFCYGESSFLRIHDAGDISVPARAGIPGFLARGLFGNWAPWASGVDALASGLLFPLDRLVFGKIPLPAYLIVAGFLFLQRWIASYFAYRLLRERFACHAVPALFAALAFSLHKEKWMSGFTFHDGLLLPGIPLVAWLITRAKSEIASFACGLALAGMNAPVFGLFTFPVVLLVAGVAPKREVRFRKVLSAFGCFAAGAAMMWLPSVWALLANAPESHRMTRTLLTPDYPGVSERLHAFRSQLEYLWVPLAVVVAGLAACRFRERALNVFAFVFLVGAGFYVPYYFIEPWVFQVAKPIHSVALERIALPAVFLACAAGGLALHQLGRRFARFGSARLVLGLIPLAAVAIQSYRMNHYMLFNAVNGSSYKTLYFNPALRRLGKAAEQAAPFRVATVGTHPAVAWVNGLETADGYFNVYPARYHRLWGRVLEPVGRADRKVHEYFHNWGNRIYLFEPPGGTPADGDVSALYNLRLLSLLNVRYVVSTVPLKTPGLDQVDFASESADRWRGLVGRQVVPEFLRNGAPVRPFYVYENKAAMPRAFGVCRSRRFGDPETLLAALASSTTEELGSTAFLEAEAPPVVPAVTGGTCDAEVNLVGRRADEVELGTRGSKPFILVLSQQYSRYWRATIESSGLPLFPVDHALTGTIVPAGVHRVRLRYAPPYVL
jgi:hypothetical protein